MAAGPVPRPPLGEEGISGFCLRALAPRLSLAAAPSPPGPLAPWERVAIPRGTRGGVLGGTWYPAPGEPRGAVLLAHPWLSAGQAYFHRGGRIEALRAAGYHVLTFDLGGFGISDDPQGYWDRDVEEALDDLARRAAGLPVHLWGVSSGGYWAHYVLLRRGVAGAVFEDVSPHLLEWSQHARPRSAALYRAFRRWTPHAYRFFDLRPQVGALKVAAAAYIGGDRDPGIPAEDTRELARRAGADCLLIPGAGHLAAIKLAPRQVIALALATFRRAEEAARV